jgi:hypothetical protein
LPGITPPFFDQPAICFATTLTELVSSYCIKATKELSRIVILRIIKFYMMITQSCLSYGPLVQILTENNRKERKTSFQIAEEITVLRSKKELRYYRELERNLQTLFHKKYTEKDKQKSQ